MVGATDTDGIGQGAEILLYVSADGTTVKGSTAATEAGITPANTYFTITVDNNPASPTFGDVTFTQTHNIWHDDTNDPDDPEALTTAAAGDLTLTQTVTDADGDSGLCLDQFGRRRVRHPGRRAGCGRDRYAGGDCTGREPGCSGWRRHCVCDSGLLGQLCGGELRHRWCWQRDAMRWCSLAPSVASGLFALDAADTTAGDGDGIGQGASIVLNKVGNDILGQIGACDLLHDQR